MAEMKTLNGYEVVDAAARADIELLKNHNHSYNDLTDKPTIPSTVGLASEAYVEAAIAAIPEPEAVDLTPYALKTEIPSTEGLASEVYVTNYVNSSIAKIEFPVPECEVVYVTPNNTGAEVKDIINSGKFPVYSSGNILVYSGQGNANLGQNSSDFFYHFSGVEYTYDSYYKENVAYLESVRCYPNRSQPWDTGYRVRLVPYTEFYALEQRVAALEGGTN